MKCAITAILAVCFATQDKIEIKFRPQEGDKLKTTQRMTMKVDLKLNAGGQEQTLAIEQRSSETRTREVAQITDGKVTRLIVDTEEDVDESKPPGAEDFQRTEKPLHGKKVTVSMKDGKPVIEGIDNPDKKTRKALRLEDTFAKLLPKEPIAVGSSWDVTGKDLKEFMDDDTVDGKLTLKITEIKEIDKRKCAVLAATFDLKGKTENDLDIAIKLTGDMTIWIDRGYTLAAKLKGTISMSAKNDQMEASGEGPMTLEMESKPQ